MSKRDAQLEAFLAQLGNLKGPSAKRVRTIDLGGGRRIHVGSGGPEDLMNFVKGLMNDAPSGEVPTEDDDVLEGLHGLIKAMIRDHLDDGTDVSDEQRKQGNELVMALNNANSLDEFSKVGDTILALHNDKANQKSLKVHTYYHALADMATPLAVMKFGADAVRDFADKLEKGEKEPKTSKPTFN
jgi:hypothetical protein